MPSILSALASLSGLMFPAGSDFADTFDAMSSTRSYRLALPRERVLAEFEKCAGTQFDPVVAKAMLTIDLTEYDRLVAEHSTYLKPGTSAAA